MRTRKTRIGAALLVVLFSGCTDLAVENLTQPETARVLSSPSDVESLIGSTFNTYWTNIYSYDGIGMMMANMSFEYAGMAANSGMEERGRIPRVMINNNPAMAYVAAYQNPWYRMYRVIAASNQGLGRIEAGLDLGSPAANARAKAFATFMSGVAHGYIGLIYDQGFIYTADIDPAVTPLEMSSYEEVTAAAIAMLDEAITIAKGTAFTLPAGWINGSTLTNTELAQIASSYKARFRTQSARSPAERGAVNWDQVITEIDAGITKDFTVTGDEDIWWNDLYYYGVIRGAWNQVTYWILGMADVSGEYQKWIATPTADKKPFILVTPDKRFPQGTTSTAQAASPGKYMKYDGAVGHVRAERGTWRWSYYRDNRYDFYPYAGYTGELREVSMEEMRLLKAEAYIRKNNPGAAADLINVTRVANGGLPPVTAAGVPQAADCVPKLPNGTCGSLLEAMKWEKRLETHFVGVAPWFFDGRGWGDLTEGTPLHLPVPAKELQTLQLPIYNMGGVGGEGAAPKGTYGW